MLLDLPNASLTPLMDGPVTEVRYAAGELCSTHDHCPLKRRSIAVEGSLMCLAD